MTKRSSVKPTLHRNDGVNNERTNAPAVSSVTPSSFSFLSRRRFFSSDNGKRQLGEKRQQETQRSFSLSIPRFAGNVNELASLSLRAGLNATTWKAHVRQRFSVSLALILCFPPRSIKRPRVPVQSNRGRIISGKTDRDSRGGRRGRIGLSRYWGVRYRGDKASFIDDSAKRIFWVSFDCIFSYDSLNEIATYPVSIVLILGSLVRDKSVLIKRRRSLSLATH